MGLKIDLKPSRNATTPEEFNLMFPGSQGSLYGRTPHGAASTFLTQEQKQNTGFTLWEEERIQEQGPNGMPTGRHAAEMILKDLSLI